MMTSVLTWPYWSWQNQFHLTSIQYPNIKPICLPEVKANYKDSEGILTGWAFNGVNGFNYWLHEVNVSLIETENRVEEKSQMSGKIHESRFSCYGDTGGPLVVTDPANNDGLTLAGVMNKNDCNSVLTFSRVSMFIEWINSVVVNAATCPPPT